MAGDVAVLLDYIGWKEERGVHVVGVSLGMPLFGISGLEYAHRLRARWYDCARFALLTARDWYFSFMIVVVSPELATLIPHHIISLSLVVTTAGGRPWNNFPPVCFTQIRRCIRRSKDLAQGHAYPDKVWIFKHPLFG